MSILDNILGAFRPKKEEQPMVVGRGVGGLFTGPGAMNYELFFKLYRSNTDLRRVIMEKQSTVGQGGWQILDKDNEVIDEGVDYENIHNIFNNRYLGNTNNWLRIKQRLIRDMDLTGNRYLFKVRNEAGQVIGIQPLDPRYVTIVADEYGNVHGFVNKVKGYVQTFYPEDVVWDKTDSDPDNEIYGFGIMESLVTDIMADQEASKANYGILKNNMIPAHLIVLEGNMSDMEAKGAIENMKAMFSGGDNRGKAGISKGIKEIIKVQATAEDMQYLDLRKFTTDKICSAFGVPKIMLGLSEGINHTNADTLYKEFIQNTVKPEEVALANMMTEVISEQYPEYRIEFIDSHIDDQEQKIDMYAKAIENGIMTVDEARAELGYTPHETVESQSPLIKGTLKLLEDAGADAIRLDLSEE